MTLPAIAPGTFLLIRCDGSQEARPDPTNNRIREAIGAKRLQFVTLSTCQGRADIVMAVDDDGWEYETVDRGHGRFENVPTRPTRPVNQRATELYLAICKPGTQHQIVGDVALAHDRGVPS